MKIKYFDKEHKKIEKNIELENIILPAVGGVLIAGIITFGIYMGTDPITNGEFNDAMQQTAYIVEEQKYPLEEIYLLYNDLEIKKCIYKKIIVNEESELGFDYSNLAYKNLTGFYPLTSKKHVDYKYEFYDISTNELVASTNCYVDSNENLLEQDPEEPTMNGYKYIKLTNLIQEDFKQNKNKDYLNNLNNDSVDDLVEEYHSKNK